MRNNNSNTTTTHVAKLREVDRKSGNARIKEVKLAKKGVGRPPKIFPAFRNSPEAQRLYKWFIKKLLNYMPEEYNLQRQLEVLFLVLQRRIVTAYVTQEIRHMPGRVLQTDGTFRFPTTLEAKFQVGTPIFVRLDVTMPDRTDIEKASHPGLMFTLTEAEYNTIVGSIEEVTGCRELLSRETLSREL